MTTVTRDPNDISVTDPSSVSPNGGSPYTSTTDIGSSTTTADSTTNTISSDVASNTPVTTTEEPSTTTTEGPSTTTTDSLTTTTEDLSTVTNFRSTTLSARKLSKSSSRTAKVRTGTMANISATASSLGITTTVPLSCSEPATIVGGSVISSGPYIANVSSAVFSCYAGFSMSGPAQVACNAAGSWGSLFPQCVPIKNNPDVDNYLTLNQQSDTVPSWLLIVLAVALGLLCLLVLTCLLLYCLKIFGCWQGGLCFRTSPRSASRVSDSETFRDDYGRKDAYRSRRVSYEDEERRQPPRRHSEFGTQTRRISETEPTTVRAWDVNKLRREAKMPSKLTWMPHSNSIRQYNTSTK